MKDEIEVEGARVIYTDEPPRPYNPLNRPNFSYKKMIIAVSLYLIIMAATIYLGYRFFEVKIWITFLVVTLIYGAVVSKKAVIWLIHLYQNKAPDKVRLRCVFEPSCSEYMLLAIQKYGLIKGFFKGARRLWRCHPPNGGKDYP